MKRKNSEKLQPDKDKKKTVSSLKKNMILSDSSDDEEFVPKKLNLASMKIRPKTQCPMCTAVVVHLPRHMRNVHGYDQPEAKYIKVNHDLRNTKFFVKAPKRKDYHQRSACPVKGCYANVKRVSQHLKDVHRVSQMEALTTFGSRYAVQIQSHTKKVITNKESITRPSKTSSSSIREPSPSASFSYSSSSRLNNSELNLKNVLDTPSTSGVGSPLRKVSFYNAASTSGGRKGNFSDGPSTSGVGSSSRKVPFSNAASTSGGRKEHFSDGPSTSGVGLPSIPFSHTDVRFSDESEYDTDNFPEKDESEYSLDNESSEYDDISDEEGYDAPRSRNDLRSRFVTYMKNKSLDKKTVYEHSRRIEVLMNEMGTDNYRKLFSSSRVGEKVRLLTKQGKKGITNQTQKKYLTALIHLCKFFVAHPKFDRYCSNERTHRLKQAVEDLAYSKRKQVLSERMERSELDASRIPKDEDVNEYLQSPARQSIIKLLKNIEKGNKFNLIDLPKFIAFFAIELSFDNANRAGEIRNMTVAEFDNAKEDDKGTRMIKVREHKTFYSHGSAHVMFRPEVWELVFIYRNKIRPLIARNDNGESPFFLSSSGKRINSGNLPRLMQNFWKEAGAGGIVGSSLIRKMSVTTVWKKCPSMAPQLSKKMTHSLNAASLYYHVEEKEKNAKEVSGKLRDVILQNSIATTTSLSPIVSSIPTSIHPPEISSPMPSPYVSSPMSIENKEISLVQKSELLLASDDAPKWQPTHNSALIIKDITASSPSSFPSHTTFTAQDSSPVPLSSSENTMQSSNLSDSQPLSERRSSFEPEIDIEIAGCFKHALNQFEYADEAALFILFSDVIERNSKVVLSQTKLVTTLKLYEKGRKMIKMYGLDKCRNKIKFLKKKEKCKGNEALKQYISDNNIEY